MERSVKEHLLILDAILAGDGQRADEHTQAHACPGGAEFFDGLVLMREQPGESSAPGQSLIGPP
jgi:DNA-binding FadR family transcriptional regulator